MVPRDGGQVERHGRLKKAREFYEAAEASDGPNAYVLLAVNAGIAAADAICIARLGQYNVGDAHRDAVGLLRKAKGPSSALTRLLSLKTKCAYDYRGVSEQDVRTARAALGTLMGELDRL